MSTILRESPQPTDEHEPEQSDQPVTEQPVTDEPANKRRRPDWRRHLIDVERGMSQGMKRESTLYAYMFALTIVIGSAVVLGLNLMQWTILILCATIVLSAELFSMALRAIRPLLKTECHKEANDAIRMGSAAVFSTVVGAVVVVGLIFAQRISAMWNG